jgi:hypothetical protein
MARRNGINTAALSETTAAAVAWEEVREVHLPIAEPDPETYIARESGHVNVQLRGEALECFRHVHAGLIESAAKLANGRPVASKPDVIQWLFEQAAA